MEIDVTPTWIEILPALLLLLDSRDLSSREMAHKELVKMARVADRYVAYRKGK